MQDLRPTIDCIFAADSVPEILHQLEAEKSEWAAKTIAALRGVPPLRIAWTLRILREERPHRTLEQCLDAEFALTHTTMDHSDFIEGVPAPWWSTRTAPRAGSPPASRT